MATDHINRDPLRNPQVDYERADLSPSGILRFLIGLFIAGVLHRAGDLGHVPLHGAERSFVSAGKPNPMISTQKQAPADIEHSVLQNTPPVNLSVFPEPRLQMNDAGEMGQFMWSQSRSC